MPEVTIRSANPVRMYWRMVFNGATEPDNKLIITAKDEETGIITVSLKYSISIECGDLKLKN